MFERTNRSVRLAEVGERIVAVARRIRLEVESIEDIAAGARIGDRQGTEIIARIAVQLDGERGDRGAVYFGDSYNPDRSTKIRYSAIRPSLSAKKFAKGVR